MSQIAHIKSTIHSTQKTRKITATMKSVALSKLYKTQTVMQRSKPYSDKMLQVIGHIAHSHTEYKHPFLQARTPIKRVGYIIISSDRGLCGGLNSLAFKLALQEIKHLAAKKVQASLCLVGNKAIQFFGRLDLEVLGHARHMGDFPSVMDTVGVVQIMLDRYRQGELDAIHVVSNEFISMMAQKPKMLQLLPIIPAELTSDTTSATHWDYIYEPDAKGVLDHLLSRYIEALVYQAVVENIACEQASRMIAMDNATKNADEIIEQLKLGYNKARQAAITQELAEIVAGSDVV